MSDGGDLSTLQRIRVFAIVAFALLMMSVDSTIVATALHSLQLSLGAPINWTGWTITAYSLGFVLMLPISGKLCQRYGQRRVFLASVLVFTLASLCCGLAGNIYVLIALRALQAAGGAGFTPSATGIVVNHFGSARDQAVSLFGSIFPIGAMIGPVFGGLFVSYLSWRAIFFVNVPIGLAVIALAWRYVPHDRPRDADQQTSMDFPGMFLLGSGLLAAMLATSHLGEADARPGSAAFLVPVLIAAVALTAFFLHIARARMPFIPALLIHGRGFGSVNLVNVLYGGVTQGIMVLLPLYAANRYGIGVFDAGILLVVQGVAAILLSISATVALRRSGYRLPLYIGGLVIVAGLLLIALPPASGVSAYAWLSGAAFLVGAGRGAINPASRNAGLQLAPESAAMLAALRSAAMQVGAIASVSIVTAILAAAVDPGFAQAWIYALIASLLLGALAVIAHVPEHRGAW